ncbi:hypothetical protein CEXT_511481 [Caerostris extrusa]|uniref:Uncharacterized protein n=1 Tax=Caerostris extrusa TaxID=172846 RepID=A0AAV4SLQ3_CAEEX|nr:hypothetical protein CEXT_511481 [Caerostris extrusa]
MVRSFRRFYDSFPEYFLNCSWDTIFGGRDSRYPIRKAISCSSLQVWIPIRGPVTVTLVRKRLTLVRRSVQSSIACSFHASGFAGPWHAS